MAGPDVHIWVRQTADWRDEEAFRAQLKPRFAPLVDLWNATFTLPYHLFRAEVRDIAIANHEAVRGARVSTWGEIPEGALVLPTDDDDWFAPDVAEAAARSVDDRPGVRWTSSFVEVPIDALHVVFPALRRALPGVGPKYPCTTNNYAMFKRPGFELMLGRHTRASYWVAVDRRRLATIDRRLSVMNRTLASQTTMTRHRRAVDRAALLRKYRRYRALYRSRLHRDLEWAQPYADRMAALMDRLETTG